MDDFLPFNPDGDVAKSGRSLPHWEQPGRAYFITFRLGDSIPKDWVAALKDERESWLELHPKPWSDEEELTYRTEFANRVESWSDRGYGDCILRSLEIREIVTGALEFFEGVRYRIDCYVVMPNHVHFIVVPLSEWKLSELLHSWKSFSAKEINKALNRSGKVWMDERFDHIVRNYRSLEKFRRYIATNPEKAGLGEGEFTLRQPDSEGSVS